MPTVDDKAQEIVSQRRDSEAWIESTYASEWEQVYKNYHCVVDERRDADGEPDPDKTHIGMPDTFALVNRRTARITANLPQVGFTSINRNQAMEDAVARKIMWDLDNGGYQRQQKRHVRQADMFGYSVRAWWWEVSEFERRRGIDISNPDAIQPSDLEQIAKTFKVDPKYLESPESRLYVLTKLQKDYGRRGLLDVRYMYKAFEGPRSKVLFIGDCFPKPFFEDLQTAGYFIIVRRRNEEWMKRMGRRFSKLAQGIQALLEDYPRGSERNNLLDSDSTNLRDRMRSAIRHATSTDTAISFETRAASRQREWTVTERWIPGYKSTVAFVAEDVVFLGEIESPYILDGKIPFTDLVLIDDVLEGIGDSVARITSGLQEMHNITTNRRFDLYRQITHPYVFTSDRSFYDNPDVLRRDLMRLVYARGGPNSIWSPNEGAAIAAMAASMGEEGAQQRMFQMAGGDSNMSMSANVDPAQLRTATGARMLQANQDVLTKDLVDCFNQSIQADVEMAYLFNRSEMADAVEFDSRPYNRNYDASTDATKAQWIKAEPIHFQVDGRLTVRLGSTLADDDEAQVAKATNLFQMLANRPGIDQTQLDQDLLIAHGKGPELSKYMAKQQPPSEPPVKASLSIPVPFERLGPGQQAAVLAAAGIEPEAVQQMQGQAEQAAAAQASAPMPPIGSGAEPPPMEAQQ